MRRKWFIIIGSVVLVAGLAFAGAGFAKSDDCEVRNGTIRLDKQSEADFPDLAKLTFDQAVRNALDAVRGKVLKTELENENGFLVYNVEVVTPEKAVMEVKVDAGSGNVLAMEGDKADNEDHEADRQDGDSERED
jgi:hypothetical protein